MSQLKLFKYYDGYCSKCGNWASGDFNPSDLGSTKKEVDAFLKSKGWKLINGENVCVFCVEGKDRFFQR
jgi:hypothetical protein